MYLLTSLPVAEFKYGEREVKMAGVLCELLTEYRGGCRVCHSFAHVAWVLILLSKAPCADNAGWTRNHRQHQTKGRHHLQPPAP